MQLYELAKIRNGENVSAAFNETEVLIIQRFEEAEHILRSNAANYRKNMAWFRQTMGASRFSEDGHAWEIRKSLTQSYLSKFDRENTFRLASLYAMKSLHELTADRPHIDDNVLSTMTASVLVDNFFGVPFDQTGIDMTLLAELMAYGSETSFVPPGNTSAVYRQTLMRLPELRREIIRAFGYFRKKETKQTPLLTSLLAADARTSDRIILEHELMTFLAAGSETSSSTIGWACYLLARHPDLQERLRESAMAFWQEDTPSWKKLSTLRPLAAFISETLRLYPPAPIVSRFAVEAEQLGETYIEAGKNVIISFIGIQHDQRFRSEPWTVDIDAHPSSKAAGDVMAFSIGPRVCGGKHFALVELITILSVYLNRASFELTDETPPIFKWKSQLLREGGHPVRVKWLDQHPKANTMN